MADARNGEALATRSDTIGAMLGRERFQVSSDFEYLHTSLTSNWRGAFLTHTRTGSSGSYKGCWSTLRVSLSLVAAEAKFPSPQKPAVNPLEFGVPGQPYEGTWDAVGISTNLFINTSAIEETFHASYSETLILEAARLQRADPVLEHLQRALLADVVAGSPGGPMLGEAIISATLQRLHVFRPSSRLEGARLSRVELRRLRAFVLANLSSPLHLDDLSKYMNTSIRHLSRTLKTTTGLSPHQFVTRCRLFYARQLLANSKASLDEIAEASGFADRSHMSTIFRKSLNFTPSQIRNGADQGD